MDRRRATSRTAAAMFVALAAALLWIAAIGPTPAADAQASCDDSVTEYDVSTTAEVNAAIVCHNQSTVNQSVLTLLNDIEADSIAGSAVFETVSRAEVVFLGQDRITGVIQVGANRIRRGPSAGTTPLPILASTEGAEILLAGITLEMGPYDTIGLDADDAILTFAAIVADSPRAGAIGFATESGAVIDSTIQGVPIGVAFGSRPLDSNFVGASTIESTEVDIRSLGSMIVDNSTLGGPVGIVFDQGDVLVRGTTVLGDAAAPLPTAALDAVVEFQSSIANTCSGDEVARFDGPGWFDNANNAGLCFAGSEFAVTAPLADNGCRLPTPVGCPRTAAIDTASSAYDASMACRDSDQRGFTRIGSGGQCDAGSFEFGCDRANSLNESVRNYDEWQQALSCHNVGTPGPSTITLLASIELQIPASVRGSNTLSVVGNGHTLSRAENASTFAAPLIRVEETGFALIDVGISVGPNGTAGIEHVGPGELQLVQSSITASNEGSTATGIVIGEDVQQFTMTGSLIRGTEVGVHIGSPINLIETSTIESTSIDAIWDATTSGGGIFNSTLAGPIGIELHENGLFVENTTILGNATALSDQAGPLTFVTFTSSIVNTCPATELVTETQPGPGWVDLGSNAGACFDPNNAVDLTVGDFFDCVNETPAGCPRLAIIDVLSPAYSAGDCSPGRNGLNEFDQAGAPRTPVGPGCDAGAFEVDDSAVLQGDVTFDGVTDNADVQAILIWLAGGQEPLALVLGDVTNDDLVRLDDALAIAQLVVQ